MKESAKNVSEDFVIKLQNINIPEDNIVSRENEFVQDKRKMYVKYSIIIFYIASICVFLLMSIFTYPTSSDKIFLFTYSVLTLSFLISPCNIFLLYMIYHTICSILQQETTIIISDTQKLDIS